MTQTLLFVLNVACLFMAALMIFVIYLGIRALVAEQKKAAAPERIAVLDKIQRYKQSLDGYPVQDQFGSWVLFQDIEAALEESEWRWKVILRLKAELEAERRDGAKLRALLLEKTKVYPDEMDAQLHKAMDLMNNVQAQNLPGENLKG